MFQQITHKVIEYNFIPYIDMCILYDDHYYLLWMDIQKTAGSTEADRTGCNSADLSVVSWPGRVN